MTSTEILVLGGGIAGVTTAWRLCEQGHDVTLLERNDLASEASGVNAGSITNLGWGRMPDLQSYLTAGSVEIFKRLALDLGFDFEYRAPGQHACQMSSIVGAGVDVALHVDAVGYRLDRGFHRFFLRVLDPI